MAFVGTMIEEEIHEMMEPVVLMRVVVVLKILEKLAVRTATLMTVEEATMILESSRNVVQKSMANILVAAGFENAMKRSATMMDLLTHRSPDDGHALVEESADLEFLDQPMEPT
jgi:hypothetical protein